VKCGGLQTGHKKCRGGRKIAVYSSDDNSEYIMGKEQSDDSVDVHAATSKEEKKVPISIEFQKAKTDKRRMRASVNMCGLVKPSKAIFDSIIDFDSALSSRSEEHKYSGNHPQ